MKRTLNGSIAISKLKHDVINVKYGDKKIPGIFLPIDQNYMVSGKTGAFYIPIRVILYDQENKHGQHGMIAQSVDSKVYKEASDEEKENFRSLPIIANLKDFTDFNNDAAGKIEMGEANPEDQSDDLPF